MRNQWRQILGSVQQPDDEYPFRADLIKEDVVTEPGNAPTADIRRQRKSRQTPQLRKTGEQPKGFLDCLAEAVGRIRIDPRKVRDNLPIIREEE